MFSKFVNGARMGVVFCLFVLAVIAILTIIPAKFGSKAQVQTGKGLFTRTESHDPGLPNYDIRDAMNTEKNDALLDFFVSARGKVGKDAAVVEDIRDGFVRGEQELRNRIPTVKVEYNSDIRTPEVITPDVWKASIEWLTPASSAKRSEILRNFVKENNDLIGVTDEQAEGLNVLADYTNPDGNLSYAHLEQLINGVPVFRGEVKAGFTKDGRIIRVINNLAPGLDYDSLSGDFRNPTDAVRAAFRHINSEPTKLDVEINNAASSNLKTVFGNGDNATTAEKMYFPIEPGVAVPAWRVLIWQPVNAFYVIVDAETGTMLWRKNITEDQTETASYQVYTNANAYMNSADSPAPLTPGPTDPTLGTQGTIITPRTLRTLIGNEAPNPGMNNLGWMTNGTNLTDGNNVEAGIDRVAPDGVDAPQPGDGACPGAGCRVFTSTWNPPPGSPAPGDDPLTAPAQRGAVIQMFYAMNLYHDHLYELGWTEQAFNFQTDNFGRGGTGNDRVRAEGQDSSGTNNANMSTPADGGRGRMQMFLWTGPTPDYDGTTDIDVVIHEITHGLSNRLHGNTAGLSTNMARGMGEGWSDWYAHTMLAEPSDPINGIYTTGGYATFLLTSATDRSNYYYGIRRFPKAALAFTGGAGNKPHNPLTFQYVNSNCNTLIGTTTSNPPPNSAFPRGPVGSATCDQVHNLGEVWSSALWEVRNIMVTRLGFAAGTKRVLQAVTDGMKLAPVGPTFLQERDAIIAAAAALPIAPQASADVADVREGFRRRGMGFSAVVNNAGTGANNTVVTEAFDFPNVQIVAPFSVSDATGDNDGFPEPGENVRLTVSVTNASGATQTNVVVSVAGGGSANVGTMTDGQTIPVQLAYTVPSGAGCGSFHQVMITASSDTGTQPPKTFEFRLGAPVGGPPTTFTNSTAIALPGLAGQTSGPAAPYPSTITTSGLTGTKLIKVTLNSVTHTFPGDLDMLLEGPGGQKYIFLSDSGGGGDVTALNIGLVDSAAAQPSTAQWVAGDFRPYNTGANDVFDPPAPAGPYTNAAPAATDTFTSVFGTNGSTMNGDWKLWIDDDAGGDSGSISGGWSLTFEANDFTCSVSKPRADFDGDGKTDRSVFRPSEGNWYLQRSTAGFSAINWGLSTDTLVPGDYDGDRKADVAVFRPSPTFGVFDFFVFRSSDNTFVGAPWGVPTDIPTVADYDGDGKDDFAIWRPSTGGWAVKRSSDNGETYFNFGQNGDVPVVGDYDGDGKADFAVWRTSANPAMNFFFVRRSSDSAVTTYEWGLMGDIPVTGDFDGDRKTDHAIFRPSTGQWCIVNSNNGSHTFVAFGLSTDILVPGDYDGDGKDDQAVYRNGDWYLNLSGSGFSAPGPFGNSTDKPVPRAYFP